MPGIDYRLDDTIAIITMNSGENRFNPDFMTAFLHVLDRVEHETNATSAVITSAHEKIFSNGLDFNWLQPVIKEKDDVAFQAFFHLLNQLVKRLVTYPLITIAAISGHAFALGAIICGAFDFRFMRSDRGYFCLPAIDVGLPFFPSMIELLKKAVPRYKLEELILTGNRLTAKECERHHIILKACHQNNLMTESTAYANRLNKRRVMIAEMKKRWNKDILHAIDVEDDFYIEAGIANIL